MANCGLWPTHRGIVAVIVDDSGVAIGPARTAARSPQAYRALLDHVEAHQGRDSRFVVTDRALALDPRLGQLAARRGAHVLVANGDLVDALCALVGAARAPPKKRALLLARLPLCGTLAAQLAPLKLQLELL